MNPVPAARPLILGVLIAIAGVVLAAGGAWLLALGGTWYDLIAGIGLCLTAAALIRGRNVALWIYAGVLLVTLVWSLGEVGLQGWKLEPRLLLPSFLGLVLLTPWVRSRLLPRAAAPAAVLGLVIVAAAGVGVVSMGNPFGIDGEWAGIDPPAAADSSGVALGDWGFYGRTAAGDRYSPLAQVTPQNVTQLKLAWAAHTGDTMQPGENKSGTDAGHEFNFENTPIKIGKNLYICTPHSWVQAYDADTGRRLWSFNPHADTSPDVYLACRGVAFYEAPAGTKTDCPRRIIAPVLDARLMALNADTGVPCADFGENGFVSLHQYLGHVPAGFHFVTSPPLVVKDRVILGGWISDNQAENEPSGAVRAFDPLSGKLVWAWDLGANPQVVHPSPDQVLTRGTPNAWGVYTADVDRGLLFLPLGNATPDYYGANRRPFDDQYSSSIVALDIETGTPRWSFQTVHHDLWDMDLPIGPSLVDLPGPAGTKLPALLQTTKRGEFFLLNRETGKPIAQVDEKPVPQDAAAGDHASPTQPYSTGMPSLAPVDLKEQDLWGATPFDQMICRIEFKRYHYEGQFTPPSLQPTIVYPAFDGIIDWHGAAIDTDRKLLIANASYIPFVVRFFPREEGVRKGWIKPWDGQGNEPAVEPGYAPQYGTPYIGSVHPWLNPLGVPCTAPPWGTLTAIDLISRKIVWQHKLGTTRDTGPFGTHFNLPLPTGIFNIGGNMVTRSGLIFIGATADDYLRAFDERSGRELWKVRLPAGGQATPMTYLGADGRQYIAIAAGGHGGLGTRSGDSLLSYALPAAAR